ncbi:MAG: hypothetical protein FWE14_06380 [Lachnospiraceae bacterium]|nr:hypothetical protein [Lachnospiraceae bacterium]
MYAKKIVLLIIVITVFFPAGCSAKQAEPFDEPAGAVSHSGQSVQVERAPAAPTAQPHESNTGPQTDLPPPTPDIAVEDLNTLSVPVVNQPSSGITVTAGTGGRGFANGSFQDARFTLPNSLLVNPNGTVMVFDTYNNAIRTITSGGTQTLAGSVEYYDEYGFPKGYYLDAALDKALLNRPADGVIDSQNNLFIADSQNHVIRVIRDGSMYTFSGSSGGYADGNHSTARFNTPMAIAIDRNDNLYVADTLNNCIRRIDPQGNVTTIAGVPGTAGALDGAANQAYFRDPAGIAVSADGNVIYVADTGNHLIRKIENGRVTTIAGNLSAATTEAPLGGFDNGPALSALFNLPRGLALADGVLYIADSANHMIRAITTAGNVVTIAGDGEPGLLNAPSGVSILNKILYIADTNNNQIKSVTIN